MQADYITVYWYDKSKHSNKSNACFKIKYKTICTHSVHYWRDYLSIYAWLMLAANVV